jgi:hypothetical protein
VQQFSILCVHVQFEQFNVHLFHQLDLKPEQKKAVAEQWHRWVLTRQLLNDLQAALAHTLHTRLPGVQDIPAMFLDALCSGTASQETIVEETWPQAEYPAIGRGCGHDWARQLVGVSPSTTAEAGALVLQWQRLLSDDTFHSWDFSLGVGGFWYQLLPQQARHLDRLAIEAGGSMFDHFKIAQLAASELRRQSVTFKIFDQAVV